MPGRPASGARARGVPPASVVSFAGGAALAHTRRPEPAYLATLFDQPSARAAPPAERWVDRTASGSPRCYPCYLFNCLRVGLT